MHRHDMPGVDSPPGVFRSGTAMTDLGSAVTAKSTTGPAEEATTEQLSLVVRGVYCDSLSLVHSRIRHKQRPACSCGSAAGWAILG